LYAEYLEKKTPNSYSSYKNLRIQLTHTKKAAKRNYFENLYREAKNPSNTWKHINQLLRKNNPTSSVPLAMNIDGKTITFPNS